MSLAKCIKKAGKNLSKSDADLARSIYKDHIDAGMKGPDAAQKAVDDVIEIANQDRSDLADDIEQRGGRVPREDRPLFSKGKKSYAQKAANTKAKTERRQNAFGTMANGWENSEYGLSMKKRFQFTAKKYFTSQGGLNQSIFEAKVGADGRDTSAGADELLVRFSLADFDNAVKKGYGKRHGALSASEQESLNDALAGGKTTGIPQEVLDAIGPMRANLDRLSDLMISSGIVEAGSPGAEVIKANKGQYLNRSYQAFDDPKWLNNVPDDVRANAEAYILSQMDPDSKSLTGQTLEQRAASKVNEILQNAHKSAHMGDFFNGSTLGTKDLGMLKKKDNSIAPEILALLGEYKDARVNYSRSASKMYMAVANHKFLERILTDNLGSLFFEDPAGEFATQLAAEGSSSLAPLNGYYTHPQVLEALQFAVETNQPGALLSNYMKVNSLLKFGKVAVAPTTQARNFLSATMFGMANGHFGFLSPKLLQKASRATGQLIRPKDKGLFGAKKNKAQLQAYLVKLKKLGVIQDNPRAGELFAALEDMNGRGDTVDAAVGAWWKKGYTFIANLYQAGDDFWKIVGFEAEKALQIDKRGLSEAEAERKAAQRIRDHYPTYSLVPPAVRGLRRFPLVGTFVSFPAEVVRTTYNITDSLQTEIKEAAAGDKGAAKVAIQRLTGIAMVVALTQGATYLSRVAMGLSEDDDEAVKRAVPPWQRNSDLLYTGYDEDGFLEYFDMTYLNPYAYLSRPVKALMTDRPIGESIADATVEIFQPFLGPEILAGSIAEAIYNITPDTQQRIRSDVDPIDKQIKDTVKHLLKAAAPGVVGNIDRTAKAAAGMWSRSNTKYTFKDEAMALVGFRASTLGVKVSLVYAGIDFSQGLRESSGNMTYVLNNPNKMSEPEIKEAYESMKWSREKVWGEMAKNVAAMRQLGVPEEQIDLALIASKMGLKNAAALFDGEYIPWEPSKQFLETAIIRNEATAPNLDRMKDREAELERRLDIIDRLVDEDLASAN